MENKTWKSITAGILSIIAGIPAIAGGIILALVATGITSIGIIPWAVFIPDIESIPELHAILGGLGIFLGAIAVFPIILGIVDIVGGVFAIKRKRWGLALAGAICSLFTAWFLGIPAIVLVIIGKEEFAQDSNTIVENIVEQ